MGDTTQLDELYVAGPCTVDGSFSATSGSVLAGGVEVDTLTVQAPAIGITDIAWLWASAPPAGNYTTGSICWNTAPNAGAAVGWIRYGGGWHRFGTVEE